ncbi:DIHYDROLIPOYLLYSINE-RESIDUE SUCCINYLTRANSFERASE COMPONENT OF 2-OXOGLUTARATE DEHYDROGENASE COMPLEX MITOCHONDRIAL-RELATED [Salix purpurea]|uniref:DIHYDROLIPOYLLYSINE-RESIDUE SUCCINYLTRANSFERASE COMPONENT OF 2-OXOGLUTARATE DEHYDROGENASE COMPLEX MITOCHONDRIAL-RELATED n=1 Tax=Salix purpurea TaxID=77065 RepID=A0A9Q0VSI6_SALPP|nr:DIHYDROLIPOYLLYSINE-RESIDUE SUCCINYLTRANSFERASE COMPONENT OF 2-OXOGLUTARATE DEHYDROGENASE COMPLEX MITOCHONDRIAL-RELATED [Salix purpurea]
MFGAVRRRFANGGFSSSILRQSLQATRLAPSSTSRVSDEILIHARGFEHVRKFSCLVSLRGRAISSRPVREVVSNMEHASSKRTWSRPFSSDTGDLVDAVVPFMGESITDGTLAKFLKNPGDSVEVDEPIAQIETDKVTIDVSSPEAGVLKEYIAKEGDTVEPGTKIAVISKSGEGVAHVAPSENISKKAAPQQSASEMKDEKKKPKVEASPVPAKPKAPAPPPPKSLCYRTPASS